VFLYPHLSEAELASYYDESYYGEERKKFLSPVQAGVSALAGWKWGKLRPLLGPGDRLLDIGCGRGTLVKSAREAGFEAWGIERSSSVGHQLPWVLDKSLPECNFPDNHFQLVVLWHVLEHLPDPLAALREICRILKPGGRLSLAVPNYGGAQAKASGARWFHLDLPRHIWHFNPSTLQKILLRTGFEVPRYRTFSFEYDWYGTLQSWMNRVLGDDNGLYLLLKGNSKKSFAKQLLPLAEATALALPALASALWDAARREGGTLSVTARKSG
jgi:SAM-dependent methyltransferase